MPLGTIDYDEDEDAPGDGDETGQWKRRLVTWSLAAMGLGLGFLIPYTLYLNHEVGERFGQLAVADPHPRLRAAAGLARPGAGRDPTLKTELDAAATTKATAPVPAPIA
jgi:penicillin-binding protein 1B